MKNAQVPRLETYSSQDLEKHPLPFGRPYSSLFGKNKIFDVRHKAWLECALGTLLDCASTKDICDHWSQQAERVLIEVFKQFCDPQNLSLWALGKLGASELNLSSDVDLLFICKDPSPEAFKQVRDFQNFLAQTTSLGFLFRCDLDLRPGGKSSPLVPTQEQVIDYYGNYGETWERIAFVRCRFLTGSTEIKNAIEPFIKRFTYRRHLDYALFDDLRGLREKIHQTVKIEGQRIHLKLAPGGIRDIELFINSLQVIHGGKNPQLQVPRTEVAFDILEKEKILPSEDILFFRELYWDLRKIENYVQALHDQQTHVIDVSEKHPDFINKLLKDLPSRLKRSTEMVSSLLGKVTLSDTPTDPEFDSIREIPLLSRNKEKDQKTREVFIQSFSKALNTAGGHRRLAVSYLKEFVQSIRAKTGFFDLLVREPKLIEDLAWLFSHSPYLARIMCQRPEMLDSFVYRSQELLRDELDLLLEQLLEKRLLAEIIQGSEFLKKKDLFVLNQSLTSVADEVVREILISLSSLEGSQNLQILALGKWGGRELGFRSDLDFVFILKNEEPTEPHFKIMRRLVSRLTEPHRGGSLYAIDMRLKPSGKAGPLIVNHDQLVKYLSIEAAAWERQAYLRSRGLTSSSEADISAYISACYHRDLTDVDLNELEEIRCKLIRSSSMDLKYSEGGMLDIELFAQTYLLKNKIQSDDGSTLNMLSKIPSAECLRENYEFLRTTEQLFQLISGEAETDLQKNETTLLELAALFKEDLSGFTHKIHQVFAENIATLKNLDPRRQTR